MRRRRASITLPPPDAPLPRPGLHPEDAPPAPPGALLGVRGPHLLAVGLGAVGVQLLPSPGDPRHRREGGVDMTTTQTIRELTVMTLALTLEQAEWLIDEARRRNLGSPSPVAREVLDAELARRRRRQKSVVPRGRVKKA